MKNISVYDETENILSTENKLIII